MPTRSAVIFPKDLCILKQLGEKHRTCHEATKDYSNKTIRTNWALHANIAQYHTRRAERFQSDIMSSCCQPLDSVKAYQRLRKTMNLGAKLQDIELLKNPSQKAASKNKETDTLIAPSSSKSRDFFNHEPIDLGLR